MPAIPPSPPSKLLPGDPRALPPKMASWRCAVPAVKVPGPVGPQVKCDRFGPDGTLAQMAGQGAASASERIGAQTLPGSGPLRLTPSQESLAGRSVKAVDRRIIWVISTTEMRRR